jgi:anaerobic selenocysteine-containing dehydrogenase
MAAHEAKSFCRICGGGCGMRLVLDENDRLLELHPDPDHPMSHGYVFFKGLKAVDLCHSPERIIHTLKRTADGNVARIGVEDALDEIAEKLIRIRAAHGVESIATFLGTAGYQAFTARPLMEAFRNALGTPANFTNNTIDQSSKLITAVSEGVAPSGRALFLGH